jgi:outer membrane protein OmpA-like peptidoglycan-associated protein/tetratricopeptide (TPR) repeat protein
MKTTTCSIILFVLACFGNFTSHATAKEKSPDKDKRYAEADIAFKHENFLQAVKLYKELLNEDPDNSNLYYKLGCSYLVVKEKEKAVYYLEKAAHFTSHKYKDEANERKAPIITYKILGEAYHQHSKFDLALNSFKKYKELLIASKNRNPDNYDEVNRQIQICYNAIDLTLTPVKAKIENMGSKVNSPFPDYAPVFSADRSTMIFTSGRPTNVGGKTYNGGKYFEDIYISTRTDSGWTEAVNIGEPINTVDNEGSVCMSADGQEILIYKDDKGDGNIYSTSLHGTEWSVPVKLNSHINSKSWEPSAFISADGRTLYFTSDRPGGYGGRDIYKSERKPGGDWGKAVNLGGSVNSEYDEDAPFLHADGVTLYFSSNGHNTMGGFDIFESKMKSDGSWTPAENVGYPINSPGDDAFYVVTPDKKHAYYTSMREGGYGEKDNYEITFPDKESPLSLQKGVVLGNTKTAPKDVKITITDNETEEVLGVYHPNTSTGKYLFILTPGKSHNISYEADGFMFYSENRYVAKEDKYNEVTKSVTLTPIAAGSKAVLNNIFFDFDKAVLRPYSSTELNTLYNFLTNHPELAVEISGYTDSKGTDDYNTKLSIERANAVITYLATRGIDRSRMVAIGLGETNPLAPNKNSDGSDSPDGRQLNRRVELKIVDLKNN